MSLVETLLNIYSFAHLMFARHLFIRCIYRVIKSILLIHQRKSTFLHEKGDQKHEIFEDNCHLSGAICTVTTNVENDYHRAHDNNAQ